MTSTAATLLSPNTFHLLRRLLFLPCLIIILKSWQKCCANIAPRSACLWLRSTGRLESHVGSLLFFRSLLESECLALTVHLYRTAVTSRLCIFIPPNAVWERKSRLFFLKMWQLNTKKSSWARKGSYNCLSDSLETIKQALLKSFERDIKHSITF